MKSIEVIENSRGHFFGLSTKQGEVLNARFVGSTPQYVRVYDRNAKQHRKFAKNSIASVSYRGGVYC